MSGLRLLLTGLGLFAALGFVVACGSGSGTGLPLQDAIPDEEPGAEVTGDDAVMPDAVEEDLPGFDVLPGDDVAGDTPVAVS